MRGNDKKQDHSKIIMFSSTVVTLRLELAGNARQDETSPQDYCLENGKVRMIAKGGTTAAAID